MKKDKLMIYYPNIKTPIPKLSLFIFLYFNSLNILRKSEYGNNLLTEQHLKK